MAVNWIDKEGLWDHLQAYGYVGLVWWNRELRIFRNADQSGTPGVLTDEEAVGIQALIDAYTARTLDQAITEKLAEMAAYRYSIEIAGITIGGVPVKTDRESQGQLNNAYTSLKNGLIPDTPWKSYNGKFTLVTYAEIAPVAQAVAQYVRACFKTEETHTLALQAIQADAAAALEADPSADMTPYIAAIDNYNIMDGWPPPPP